MLKFPEHWQKDSQKKIVWLMTLATIPPKLLRDRCVSLPKMGNPQKPGFSHGAT